MRPLELRVRNFRSFYGDDHIFNFRDRRLVGIVGPIGSGKSSILDAITFALYGRTARSGVRTKSLIHQRAENATVALRFVSDGAIWEAVRHIQRKGSSVHQLFRLADDRRESKQIEKYVLEKIVTERVETLLGVDFHSFGRSVMLAQGQFAEFLGATPADRDAVLKRMFGYDRVADMHKAAKDSVRDAEHEIDKLSIRLEHTKAAKERLVERREHLHETVEHIRKLNTVKPTYDKWAERISSLALDIRNTEERIALLESHTSDLPNQERGHGIANRAVEAFKDASHAELHLNAAEDSLAESQTILESDEFSLGLERLAAITKLLTEIRSERERLQSQHDSLREKTLELPEQQVGLLTIALSTEAEVQRRCAARDWKSAETQLRRAEQIADSDEHTHRVELLREAEQLVARIADRRVVSEQATSKTAQAQAEAEKTSLIEADARRRAAAAQAAHEQDKAAASEAKTSAEQGDKDLTEAVHTDMSLSLRSRLTLGDTCPVCTQRVEQLPHSEPETSDALNYARSAATSAREAAERSERESQYSAAIAQDRMVELAAASDRRASSEENLRVTEAESRQHAAGVAEYLHEFRRLLGDGEPDTVITANQKSADLVSRMVCKARRKRDESRSILDDALQKETATVRDLADLRTRIGSLSTILYADSTVPSADPDSLAEALRGLHTDWSSTIRIVATNIIVADENIATVEERRKEENRIIDDLQTAVERAREARDKAQTAYNRAMTGKEEVQKDVANLRASVGSLTVLLTTDAGLPGGDPDDVLAAMTALHADWEHEISGLYDRTQDLDRSALKAEERLAMLRSDLNIDADIDVALAEEGAKRNQIEADIARDETLIASQETLIRRRKACRREARTNQRLVKDLTNSRFVRFLLDEERRILSDLGSEPFTRLSAGRYRFTEDGTFGIVDLNTADRVRRSDSLSGGETFLASLALALGLAEMVSRKGGQLDAFFLDEGFGTLDQEHLDLAMEGVEVLSAGATSRLVVVVSHVPDIQQRMEDLIILDKDPATGDSRVKAGDNRTPVA